ncbi:MAG: hypothetical protein JO249_08810 [Acidobacteria bacterium]|nr:hypothetical protein [Acidobacteriota bacterium]
MSSGIGQGAPVPDSAVFLQIDRDRASHFRIRQPLGQPIEVDNLVVPDNQTCLTFASRSQNRS